MEVGNSLLPAESCPCLLKLNKPDDPLAGLKVDDFDSSSEEAYLSKKYGQRENREYHIGHLSHICQHSFHSSSRPNGMILVIIYLNSSITNLLLVSLITAA
jgi:hypothetical protein